LLGAEAIMKALESLILRIEAVCQFVAMLLILAIMMIVFSDVVFRYVFSSPLHWAYDVVNLYLMAGLFFLALSYSYAAHAHIGVDILLAKLPTAGVRIIECVTCLVAIPLFGLIGWAGFHRSYENWTSGDVVSGPVAWPTWIGPAFMAFGAGLLVLRLAFRLIGNAASLATGNNLVEPLPVGTHEGVE
jgi:TRAP-type C4-dicarboxylate transport system permease small subunit